MKHIDHVVVTLLGTDSSILEIVAIIYYIRRELMKTQNALLWQRGSIIVLPTV